MRDKIENLQRAKKRIAEYQDKITLLTDYIESQTAEIPGIEKGSDCMRCAHSDDGKHSEVCAGCCRFYEDLFQAAQRK